MSSLGDVVIERDGGSMLWAVKGRLVSTVIVAVESDVRRRVAYTEEESGFMNWLMARRLVDRAILRFVEKVEKGQEFLESAKKERGEGR